MVAWLWTAIAWLAGWLGWLLWQPFRGLGLLLWPAVEEVVMLLLTVWDAMLDNWGITLVIMLPVMGLSLVVIVLWVPPWESYSMEGMAHYWPYVLGAVGAFVAAPSFVGGFLLARLNARRRIEALVNTTRGLRTEMDESNKKNDHEKQRLEETSRSLKNKIALQVYELSRTDNALRRENRQLQADIARAHAELERVQNEAAARVDAAEQVNKILKATLELERTRRR